MTATEKKIVVLFDEFGTPTFKNNNTSDFFLGVAALYELSDEDKIFNALDGHMGLSNTKSLKNGRIKVARANEIAKEIVKHDVKINAKYLDLTNPLLHHYTEFYTKFGNFSRNLWRRVKDSKDAHFLHSQILEDCLFDIISRFIEDNTPGKYRFEICIDDWSYPTTDRNIVLEYSPQSLQKHIQEFINGSIIKDAVIIIEPIKFFGSINIRRESFIDALTSIISRSFIDRDNNKFDLQPLNELIKGIGNNIVIEDITVATINFTHETIYKFIQATKVQDKSLIIL